MDALESRSQLASALAVTKRARCSIVVAKLYRLSRDVVFIAGLMASRARSLASLFIEMKLRGLFSRAIASEFTTLSSNKSDLEAPVFSAMKALATLGTAGARFDKKAFQREYMRKRRAAAKKSINVSRRKLLRLLRAIGRTARRGVYGRTSFIAARISRCDLVSL